MSDQGAEEPVTTVASFREQRLNAIKALQAARGSDALIVYITSTRPGVQVQMAADAVRRIYDQLPRERVKKLDLFVVSNGGDGTVPWRLMTLLRERADKIDALVPSSAFSAATLACLGADNIVMHPMGVLGPIDPTIGDPYERDPQTGQNRTVAVEDVASFIALIKEDVGIRHEDELVQAFGKLADRVHPLTLGHAKRGTGQARMLGEKLLRLRDPKMDPHKIASLIEELTTKLYYHGHPIGRREAREDLNLPVLEPSAEVEVAMWDLYLVYEKQLKLDVAFDAVAEAIAAQAAGRASGLVIPSTVASNPADWEVTVLDPLRLAVVEGLTHGDVYEQELRVATKSAPDGGTLANITQTRAEWVRES
jgi:hypothetical protein